jgi:hypothetical protein
VNFGPWCEVRALMWISGFYNFGSPEISPARLSNYGPCRGPRARPMGRPEIQTIRVFLGLDRAGPGGQMYTYIWKWPPHLQTVLTGHDSIFLVIGRHMLSLTRTKHNTAPWKIRFFASSAIHGGTWHLDFGFWFKGCWLELTINFFILLYPSTTKCLRPVEVPPAHSVEV